jgi:hypothetical protein
MVGSMGKKHGQNRGPTLPLVEFAYNNGYQASLKMSPFEALYGRPCNTPVRWSNPIKNISFGPDMLKEME